MAWHKKKEAHNQDKWKTQFSMAKQQLQERLPTTALQTRTRGNTVLATPITQCNTFVTTIPPPHDWESVLAEAQESSTCRRDHFVKWQSNCTYQLMGQGTNGTGQNSRTYKYFSRKSAEVSFRKGTPRWKLDTTKIKLMMLNSRIYSVKLHLTNIMYFNKPLLYDQIRFSQTQLVVMVHLGTEWLHNQPPPKHERDSDEKDDF
jgi:hypothetical protein